MLSDAVVAGAVSDSVAESVSEAAERIAPYLRHTPVLRATVDGRPVVLKLELLELTGSFKVRGALNALLSTRPDRVVTASGGNHGLAVATAAALLDIPATVYTPLSVPAGKARRIEATGAKLIRHGATYAEAAALAMTVSDALYLPAHVPCPATTSGWSYAGRYSASDTVIASAAASA
jgi:threonine dehydratase